MIQHGGTSPIQGKTTEAYRNLQPGAIPSWYDILTKAPALRWADQLAEGITRFTFDNLQRRFKVTDYATHAAAWMAEHPELTPAEVTAAKRSIAKEVNAVYGGLHWENLGWNRMTTEVARALMLAPDWTFSNLFNLKYVGEGGLRGNWRDLGSTTPSGKMARAFWLRSIVGGLAATELASYLITGRSSPDWQHHPTEVYMGRDRQGRDVYQNMFFKGAPGDITKLAQNIAQDGPIAGLARTLSGKLAPVPRTATELLMNRDWRGRPIVPQGMNPLAGTVRSATHIVSNLFPVPFVAQNLYDILLGPDKDRFAPREFLTTPFFGTPPRHVPPPGMRTTGRGLRPIHPSGRSVWEQIKTGKP
jgi:hypothetical protein